MLTIFYSPHMTSTDNEAGRATGHADVPLSADGEQKSRELGQHYASYALDVVFPSDLQRAISTAHIAFASRGLPIIPDARLRETDYGDLTQAPVDQIDAAFIQHFTEPFPRGESLCMAVQRVGEFLRNALHDHDGKTVVIIGHRVTKYGLDYWCGETTLEEIVVTPWEWRNIPIWRYELSAQTLDQRAPCC